jgi:hypothetical protein
LGPKVNKKAETLTYVKQFGAARFVVAKGTFTGSGRQRAKDGCTFGLRVELLLGNGGVNDDRASVPRKVTIPNNTLVALFFLV